ncbi:hypothetical protein [Mycobacterium lepromatosis]
MVDAIEEIDIPDNTFIIIIDDNGASAKGTPVGCFNEQKPH